MTTDTAVKALGRAVQEVNIDTALFFRLCEEHGIQHNGPATIFTLLERILNSGRPDSLRDLLELRLEFDFQAVVALREMFSQGYQPSLDKLYAIVDQMEQIESENEPSLYYLCALDLEFHAHVAMLANLLGVGDFILALTEVSEFDLMISLLEMERDRIWIAFRHGKLIDAILDLTLSDDDIRELLHSHCINGEIQDSLLQIAVRNRNEGIPRKESVMDDSKKWPGIESTALRVIADKRLNEYALRVRNRRVDVSTSFMDEIASDIQQHLLEFGDANLTQLDAKFERYWQWFVHQGQSEAIELKWLSFVDENGNERLATMVEGSKEVLPSPKVECLESLSPYYCGPAYSL